MLNKGHRKGYIEQILKKEKRLKAQVLKQKIYSYDSLYQLKHKEGRQRQKCFCKGGNCSISHSRYRWTVSRSDTLLKKLKLMDSNESNESKRKFKCDKCEIEFIMNIS